MSEKNALEFGPPMGLPESENAKRLEMQREVHLHSCETTRSLWILNDALGKHAQHLKNEVAQLKQPVVAVHVRGGDKLFKEIPKEYQVGLLEGDGGPYSLGASKLLAAHPESRGGTCVIIGDDWYVPGYESPSYRLSATGAHPKCPPGCSRCGLAKRSRGFSGARCTTGCHRPNEGTSRRTSTGCRECDAARMLHESGWSMV